MLRQNTYSPFYALISLHSEAVNGTVFVLYLVKYSFILFIYSSIHFYDERSDNIGLTYYVISIFFLFIYVFTFRIHLVLYYFDWMIRMRQITLNYLFHILCAILTAFVYFLKIYAQSCCIRLYIFASHIYSSIHWGQLILHYVIAFDCHFMFRCIVSCHFRLDCTFPIFTFNVTRQHCTCNSVVLFNNRKCYAFSL